MFKLPDNKTGTLKENGTENKITSLSDKSTEYYSKLKGLNETVSQWIKTHVDKNPFCILTPIFQDYERFLKEIEDKKETKGDNTSDKKELFNSTPVQIPEKNTAQTIEQSSIKSPEKTLVKETPTEEKKEETKSPFGSKITFGTTPNPFGTPSTGFSFGTGKERAFQND